MTDRSCPEEFVLAAEAMADAARLAIRPHFREVTAEAKGDETPVTIADKEAERVIREIIEERFPDHEIAGEEWGTKRTGSPWCWHLDPIDGTKSFTAGSHGFSTLIALARDGEPVLGVLDQPILEERWLAHGENQTTLNGKPIACARDVPIERAIFHTSGMEYFPPELHDAVRSLMAKCWFSRLALDCYGYGLLAAGFVHISMDGMVNPYDVAALIPIVRNAGGQVSDLKGRDIVLEGKIPGYLTSASAELHRIGLATFADI